MKIVDINEANIRNVMTNNIILQDILDEDILSSVYSAEYHKCHLQIDSYNVIMNDKNKTDYEKTNRMIKSKLKASLGYSNGQILFKSIYKGGKVNVIYMGNPSKQQTRFNFYSIDNNEHRKYLASMLTIISTIDIKLRISEQEEMRVDINDYSDQILFCAIKKAPYLHGLLPFINITEDTSTFETCIAFNATEKAFKEDDTSQSDELMAEYKTYNKCPVRRKDIPFLDLYRFQYSKLFLLMQMRLSLCDILKKNGIQYRQDIFTPRQMAVDFNEYAPLSNNTQVCQLVYNQNEYNENTDMFDECLNIIKQYMTDVNMPYKCIPYSNFESLEIILKDNVSIFIQRKQSDKGYVNEIMEDRLNSYSDFIQYLSDKKIFNPDQFNEVNENIDDYSKIKINRFLNFLQNKEYPFITQGLIIEYSDFFTKKGDKIKKSRLSDKLNKTMKEILLKIMLYKKSHLELPGTLKEDIMAENITYKKNAILHKQLFLTYMGQGNNKSHYNISDMSVQWLEKEKGKIYKISPNERPKGVDNYADILIGDKLIVMKHTDFPYRLLYPVDKENEILESISQNKKFTKEAKDISVFYPRLLRANNPMSTKKLDTVDSKNCNCLIHYKDGQATIFMRRIKDSCIIKSNGVLSKDTPLMTLELYRKQGDNYEPLNFEDFPELLKQYISLIPFNDTSINQISKMNIVQKLCNLLSE